MQFRESSDHAACHCPYRAYVDASCTSVRKINEWTDQMVETMKRELLNIFNVLIKVRRIVVSLTLV